MTNSAKYQLIALGVSLCSNSLYADVVELKDDLGGGIADWYRYSGQYDANFATVPWRGDAAFESTTGSGGDVDAGVVDR